MSGLNISFYGKSLVLTVLFVAFVGYLQLVTGNPAAFKTDFLYGFSTVASADEPVPLLSQGKQRLAQDAKPPYRVAFSIQKAGTPLRTLTFCGIMACPVPQHAVRPLSGGTIELHFTSSIQPQAP